MDHRKNTVKVQLPGQSEKPLDSEMLKWVIVDLGLKDDEIVGMSQNPANDGVMYIKCVSENKMREIIGKFDGVTFKYGNGTIVRVTMSEAAENVRYVRIFGLPFEVEDEHIEGFFRSFGTVKRLVKEKYPAHYNFDVLSGVRGVYIDLKKDVPAFLYMRGVRVKVHYYGMKEKCHISGSPDHMRNECPLKPIPIVSPSARLDAMTNLNGLFKKPFGRRTEDEEPIVAKTVSPMQTFAETVAGKTPSTQSNGNHAMMQQQLIVPTASQQAQPIIVTVTNTVLDSQMEKIVGMDEGDSGKSTLQVQQSGDDSINMEEDIWKPVRKSSRSNKNASPAKTGRVRTDSSSSAVSEQSVSRGRGRPKKPKQQLIQMIADYTKEQFGKSTAPPAPTALPVEKSDK